MENQTIEESLAKFSNDQGLEVRATLKYLSRHQVVVEFYNPLTILRTSEVLENFQILIKERICYQGKAVVRNVILVGVNVVCDVTLQEAFWIHVDGSALKTHDGAWAQQFKGFINEWQKLYRVSPDYKLIVGDMHTFLTDFQLWGEQVEVNLRASNPVEANQRINAAAAEVAEVVIPLFNGFFEQFEVVAEKLDPGTRSMHGSYMKRHLHPLVLCSPFASRTYQKPLGYAGDYEMINMIARDGYEGESLYAKVINRWFLKQPPAVAHRNRLVYLTQKLADETLRVSLEQRRTRVFNLACGPAWEVQAYLANQDLSRHTDFALLDFNEETIHYTQRILEAIRRKHGRESRLEFIKKSVHHLLKESSKNADVAAGQQYDFVYCAGLFDYLSDQVCHRLMNLMYKWVAPGGLLVATNVEPTNPLRNGMEHLLDWHLNYRRAGEFRKLAPDHALPDSVHVFSEDTGVNVMMEVRRPRHD